MSVLNFLQLFQQHSLLDNVNFAISTSGRFPEANFLSSILAHILPLIGSIESIQFQHWKMHDLARIFNGQSNSEYPEYIQIINQLLAMPRIVETRWFTCVWILRRKFYKKNKKPNSENILLLKYS
jgi:hypothetical protein